MLCEKCGREIPDNSESCAQCIPQAEQKKKSRINKKLALIIGAIAAALIIAVTLILVFTAQDKGISMKNYVKVNMEGFEGYGRMTFEFGDVTFGMRAAGDEAAIKFGDREDSDYFVNYRADDMPQEYRENLAKAKRLLDSIEIDYTLTSGKDSNSLKNGDVFTFTVTYNQLLAEDMELSFKDTTFQYVVEGLNPLEQFDLLSYCELKVEGFNGFGRVELACKETITKQVGDITFYMEEGKERIRYTAPDGYSGAIALDVLGESFNKSNGDVIKPNLNIHAKGFAPYGVEVIGLGKEYTVSGLPDNPS